MDEKICPVCKSDETERQEMVYLKGTLSGSSTGHNANIGISSNNLFSFSLGKNRMDNESQSGLAKITSPPGKSYDEQMIGIGSIVYLMVVFCKIYSLNLHIIFKYLLSIIAVFGGAILLGLFLKPSIERDKTAQDTWKKEWICLTCGHKWIPEEAEEAQRFINSTKSDN